MSDARLTTASVADWLKLQGEPDAALAVIVPAVSSFIDRLPDTAANDGGTAWTDEAYLAALMLSARLYRRRNSPTGIESFTEAGATYVSRYDPDLARMLGLDAFTKPQVG